MKHDHTTSHLTAALHAASTDAECARKPLPKVWILMQDIYFMWQTDCQYLVEQIAQGSHISELPGFVSLSSFPMSHAALSSPFSGLIPNVPCCNPQPFPWPHSQCSMPHSPTFLHRVCRKNKRGNEAIFPAQFVNLHSHRLIYGAFTWLNCTILICIQFPYVASCGFVTRGP